MSAYTTTVGIEVHAELNTKSKMFCGCPNNPHAAEENVNLCAVCLAHPGTLPTVNKSAVESVLLVGRAIDANLASYSEFDRKNYFYPDIPKAYQLSQYDYPLVIGGKLAGVAITRIHLEEDTARSQHDEQGSSVDFNRAGVPLMELVTEPVIHDAETAGRFARELQLLLRTLQVSDANMERGEMRVEANISVSKTDKLGTKVEVKNLNSFKVMEQAIEYETKRQIELIEADKPVVQETRGWDESKQVTFTQRTKEEANDYRYFPDPDIPKLNRETIPEFAISRFDEIMPMLATEWRTQLRDLGIKNDLIERLLFSAGSISFFGRVQKCLDNPAAVSLAANYIVSDIAALDSFHPGEASDEQVQVFAELMALLADDKINSRIAKDLLPEVLETLEKPEFLAVNRNLLQNNDDAALAAVIDEIIAEHPAVVADFNAGKTSSLKFFVGQGMKATKGSANPTRLAELFKAALQSK